jgi:hypothetical protein
MFSDNYNLESSSSQQSIDPIFINKNLAYVEDQNTNYATQQVKFDISSLYNQSKFINPKDMELVIPLVAVLSVSKGATASVVDKGLSLENGYCMGFKSGYYNLISSINITYNQKTVQQNTQNLNYLVNFNKLTKLTHEKVEKEKYNSGFNPDSSNSWKYNLASEIEGNGVTNNNPLFVVNDLKSLIRKNNNNSGFFDRMNKTAFKTDTNLLNASELNNELKSYNITDNNKHVIYDTAHIKLSDISSFFENMPMTKSFNCTIIIELNLGSLKLDVKDSKLSLSAGDIDFRKGTCPLMISPIGKGLNILDLTEVTEIVLGLHCVDVLATKGSKSQSTLGVVSHSLKKCRIYVPMIQMEESVEEKYELNMRNKQIFFNDYNYYTLLNVTGDINFSLSNTLSNLRGVLLVPFISSAVNGKIITANVVTHLPFSPTYSPFTSEPSTTSPLMRISNLNIQLAGENVYSQNLDYGFQMYKNEVAVLNAIDGNQNDRFTSGLISQEDWDNNYRYYYVDLSRKIQDNSMKSIQIMGRNASAVAMDIHIYLIYTKKAIIDCVTGVLAM